MSEPDLSKSSDDPPTISIIDDDESIRLALAGLFRSVGLHSRSFCSVVDFLASGETGKAGCLVVDVRLPGISGLDFQGRLEDLGICLPVVLMTGHGDIPMSVRAMKAGAIDFLPKPFRDQDMLDAVNRALEANLARRSAETEREVLLHRFTTLSPREKQVMSLVTAGKMNKQVAAELELSEITVKIHRGAAMRKMEARSLASLVRMAGELETELKSLRRHTNV